MRVIGWALALTAGVLACAASDDATTALSAADEAAIRSLIDEWGNAWVAGDPGAVVALYTDDFVEARPTAVVGRQAILDSYQGFTSSYTEVIPTVRHVEGVGNLAYAFIEFQNRYTREDGSRRIQIGTGLWVLKKDSEGRWRFAASGWQSSSGPDSAGP
jgi:uncharacterized protein (TIGR02246 family)